MLAPLFIPLGEGNIRTVSSQHHLVSGIPTVSSVSSYQDQYTA